LSVVGKSQGIERFFQQPRTNNRQPSAKGFTLIEVLVGVLVLALALMALTRTAAIQVQSFGDLRERTLAGWLAADVLAETRLANPFPPTGKSDGQRKFAGRDWHWQLNVEATDVATMRRLNVYVYTSAESKVPVAALVGFGGTDLVP
jgi:general secretion pathway protein I